MRSVPTISIAALLLACSPTPESNAGDVPTNALAPATPGSPAPAAQPFAFKEKNDLIDFEFEWSAEAAAVPELVARFTADMNKAKAELLAGAKEEQEWRAREKLEFNGYQGGTSYTTAGQSPRLLSLTVHTGSYTGGAHPNHAINALIWDRRAAREIKSADLFAAPENRDRMLKQAWCDALNRQREEKREEPVSGDGPFDECTSLDYVSFQPTDRDGNGRFERFDLTASPYVAGPYSEGYYEVELPVTADLIATLKSEYRDSFEALQPQ